MERRSLFELLPALLVFLDAVYFILQPRNVFNQDQGKLFGTQMYRKSSIFFSVVNGANYTLKISVLAFVLWFIIPVIRNKASFFIPPLTVSLVWAAERFRNSLLEVFFTSIFSFSFYIGARLILQKVSTYEYEHPVIRFCIVGSVQTLLIFIGYILMNWIGFVD